MEPGVERDGAYFLDRDPHTFSIVLNYLRSGVLFGKYNHKTKQNKHTKTLP